jgi:hypothetical protein
MSLTADREYQTINPTDINKIKAGAADTLYKGAIINIGTNGFAKVAADVAGEVPLGINTRQVIAAGANAEMLDVESGVFRLLKVTNHKFTVHVTSDVGADNAKFNGKYFVIYSGATGYYVWFKVTDGGAGPDPAPAGLTGVEVDIVKASTDAQIAALIETALEAVGAGGGAVFNVSTATHVCTVTVTQKGACETAGNGTADAVILVTNTVLGTAVQADVGLQFYAIADDGVVYASEKSNVTAAVGLCVGLSTNNYLWIDTKIRAI